MYNIFDLHHSCAAVTETPTGNWNRCKNIKSCKQRMIIKYYQKKKTKKNMGFSSKTFYNNGYEPKLEKNYI